MTARRQLGDRAACRLCGLDIEWGGRAHGWRDRGGNGHCDTGGAARHDDDGHPVPFPHRKHHPLTEAAALRRSTRTGRIAPSRAPS